MRLLPVFAFAMVAIAAISAQTPGAIPAPPDVAAPPKDAKKSSSGLATKVLQPGTGKEHPTADDLVTVHYTGWTTDGKMFDSSVVRGTPSTFPLNRVIAGWTEGVQLMVIGEKRRFSPCTISCTPSVQPAITRSSGNVAGLPRETELSNILPSVVQPV